MRRIVSSWGYVKNIPKYRIMFDGEAYTVERRWGGPVSPTRFKDDAAARAVLPIEWRKNNVVDGVIRSIREEFA